MRVVAKFKSYPALSSLLVVVGFFWVIGMLQYFGYMPKAIIWLYLSASALSFLLYYFDKNAAVKGNRRTPEATLHNVSLVGGWPGALLAQQMLRHKSKKKSFRVKFWVTVALNASALAYLLSPYGAWLASEFKKIAG